MSARRRRSTVDFRHRRASEIVDQDVEAERDGEAVLGLLASVRRFAYVADADSKTDARFPFVLWRPRDGRNQAYALWIINLQQLLKALAPTFSQRRARCLQVQRDRLASSLRTRSMCLVRQSSPRRASETSENQKDRSISEDQSWSLGDRDLQ